MLLSNMDIFKHEMSLLFEYTGGIHGLAHSQTPVVCLDACKQGKTSL